MAERGNLEESYQEHLRVEKLVMAFTTEIIDTGTVDPNVLAHELEEAAKHLRNYS